ncbi:MAG TPA: DUF2865 domain-containing protein [Methylocystis sp.]|nr:DUF2865 domain-containing protein [Methylocystis sp.]
MSGEKALAQNPYCNDLRAQIARASAGSGSSRNHAAAKQQAELYRAIAYARSIGCERQQFLFFGDPPPPQCGALNAKIEGLRAAVGSLGGGDDARKQALQARYDEQCRPRPAPEPNFLEQLFGLDRPQAPPQPSRDISLLPDSPFHDQTIEEERPRGGSEAVCVRLCDGAFFPIMYSARNSNLDDLNTLCKALCPNAEAELYTKGPWKDIDTAVSIGGEPYSDLPNALKFQKTRDPSCSCKAKGQSWVEALGEAERILETTYAKDEVITAEQAEQMSRPLAAGGASPRNRKNQSSRRDIALPEPARVAGAPSADAPSPQTLGQAEGEVRETVGADGVTRRVRVVAPAL